MNTHTAYVVVLTAMHLAVWPIVAVGILRGHRAEQRRRWPTHEPCSVTSCSRCWGSKRLADVNARRAGIR